MHTEIATETLKTGETLHIERVTAPDEKRGPQIAPFLGHKPPVYKKHIELALAGQCDDLETHFTIGLIDGEVVGNIMTLESRGVGIFGHVFTREDQRRKGICQNIMRHQMEDFRRREGHILLLGTGYQSAAYWIYHSFGFRDWEGDHPGLMRYAREDEPDFEERFFAPAPCRPVPAGWKHWPLAALLASIPGPTPLRSLYMRLWDTNMLEGPYCEFMAALSGKENVAASALESETGAVMALAICQPDSRWRGAVRLLDVFGHPNARGKDMATLLESLPLPEAPVQCYADPRDSEKIAALEQTGFRREAVLPGQYRVGETWRDVWLYARR